MCLILFAHRVVPGAPLIVAANRDERFDRPAQPAAIWEDHPDILAGRDLVAGGTWLGVSRLGRFAALTNFRDPETHRAEAPSRGELVQAFLTGRMSPRDYAGRVAREAHVYNGFSLLAGDGRDLWFFSNRGGAPAEVDPGVHGLPNNLLDAPWPKVVKGRAGLAQLIRAPFEVAACLALLDDPTPAPDAELPQHGRGIASVRRRSGLRIMGPHYGTRCSTVVRITAEGTIDFAERTFRADGSVAGEVRYRLGATAVATQ